MARGFLRTLMLCSALLLMVGCSASVPDRSAIRSSTVAAPDIREAAMVHDVPTLGVEGMNITLDGRAWWPIGINAYQLGTDWSINAGCGAQVDLDTFFGQLPPHSLVRFNAFSSLALNKNTGLLDFTALDAVVRAAERYGQLLIAVLSSDEGSCEDEVFKGYEWYAGNWRTEVTPGMPMTFSNWLDTAVRRWADSPALAGWTAVGEPEPSDCTDSGCTWQLRQCRPGSAQVLREFFDVTGARIHELDPGTTTFNGLAGGGQCGAAGDEFAYVNASPGIDVLEYHFYASTDTLPGNEYDGLGRRIEQARALDKPLLIAEIGMQAGSCGAVDDRGRMVQQTLTELRNHEAAGALFWSYVPDPRPQECTLDIGPADPLMHLVGRQP